MLTRAILAALLATGAIGAVRAEVQVKTPGVEVEAPSGGVDIDVGANRGPSEAWIHRPVYSSDGKHIGEIVAVANGKAYADIGGFLGLGETRVQLRPDVIARIEADRVDLTLTAEQANDLPAATEPEPVAPN